jgi:hypothetical protein
LCSYPRITVVEYEVEYEADKDMTVEDGEGPPPVHVARSLHPLRRVAIDGDDQQPKSKQNKNAVWKILFIVNIFCLFTYWCDTHRASNRLPTLAAGMLSHTHREYRLPGFFSRSSKLAPPAPSPAGGCHLAPFGSKGVGHTPLRERGRGGGGEPIRTMGQTLWYSRYSIIHLRHNPTQRCCTPSLASPHPKLAIRLAPT